MRHMLYNPNRRMGKPLLPNILALFRVYGSHGSYGSMAGWLGSRVLTKCMQEAIRLRVVRPLFAAIDLGKRDYSTVTVFTKKGHVYEPARYVGGLFPDRVWFDELMPDNEGASEQGR